MKAIKLTDIEIPVHRQRKEFEPNGIIDLANSIDGPSGLLHPVVVRTSTEGTITLVAGERRLRAIETLWGLGGTLRCDGKTFLEGFVPTISLGELDPVDAFEAELEENLRRQDLTWQERSHATSQLFELRRLQNEKNGIPPSIDRFGNERLNFFGREVYPEVHPNTAEDQVRKELILSRHLSDPEVAKAPTLNEGFKILKRKEETQRQIALGEAVGKHFNAADHRLLQGDCLAIMQSLDPDQFDVILTDPPYGIEAQSFNDSGGKANSAGHSYDDSYQTWQILTSGLAKQSFRLAKPQAHLYCFCDVERFLELRFKFEQVGWKCFRTPFIWHNPSGQRAPWPQTGPHRKYQMFLYAVKGSRPVLKLSPDLVTYASDQNLGWAAQKPLDLYRDLLLRSCRAGDSVLDPFCGSGVVFPAAHSLKIKATGIELDPTAYGISVMRLGELK
jgi:site-specific DNA-methyltransferase (adenine-specific)